MANLAGVSLVILAPRAHYARLGLHYVSLGTFSQTFPILAHRVYWHSSCLANVVLAMTDNVGAALIGNL